MAVFTYTARDNTGTLVQGDVTASTPADAAKVIRGEGKFVVKVEAKGKSTPIKKSATPTISAVAAPKTKSKSSAATASTKPAAPVLNRASRTGKYNPADLIYFTNQLAVMTETGVSLAEALDACVHDGNSPRFSWALNEVIDSVKGGSTFSAALAAHPRIFPVVYVSLMKASEASGTLGPMLHRLATHLEAQREMTKKIKGAVTYPIVMFTFAIGVTIFLMTFVLPKFVTIYAGREDKIPVLTRYLLAFSAWLMIWGWYLLAGIIAAAVGAFFYFRRPAGKRQFEIMRLSLPLMGPLFHKAYLSRSLRTLGTMIQSGVSMLDSVKLTAAVSGSIVYEEMWNNVNSLLQGGHQLSDALADNKNVPKAINKMLAAGERTGQLGPVMERVANFCEGELNISIKTMTALLEPAIVMFLGVVVGGLVLALLLPIFTISKAMH